MILEIFAIAQYEFLAEYCYLIDVIQVDDMSLADAGKHCGSLFEACAEQGLHLRQVHTYRSLHLVVENDVGIVAIRLEIYYFRNIHSEEFISRVKIEIPRFVHRFNCIRAHRVRSLQS